MTKFFPEAAGNVQSFERLKDFFDQHCLEESRSLLWKWLNVTGSRGFSKLTAEERDSLLVFYAHLQGLIETVHEIKVTLHEHDPGSR